MTILEAAAALRAGKVSSMELVQGSLQRIARLNPTLNAFLTVTEDEAVERALQADDERKRGIDRGPLHGIPIALKDVFATKGVRTSAARRCSPITFPIATPRWWTGWRRPGRC